MDRYLLKMPCFISWAVVTSKGTKHLACWSNFWLICSLQSSRTPLSSSSIPPTGKDKPLDRAMSIPLIGISKSCSFSSRSIRELEIIVWGRFQYTPSSVVVTQWRSLAPVVERYLAWVLKPTAAELSEAEIASILQFNLSDVFSVYNW